MKSDRIDKAGRGAGRGTVKWFNAKSLGEGKAMEFEVRRCGTVLSPRVLPNPPLTLIVLTGQVLTEPDG